MRKAGEMAIVQSHDTGQTVAWSPKIEGNHKQRVARPETGGCKRRTGLASVGKGEFQSCKFGAEALPISKDGNKKVPGGGCLRGLSMCANDWEEPRTRAD